MPLFGLPTPEATSRAGIKMAGGNAAVRPFVIGSQCFRGALDLRSNIEFRHHLQLILGRVDHGVIRIPRLGFEVVRRAAPVFVPAAPVVVGDAGRFAGAFGPLTRRCKRPAR